MNIHTVILHFADAEQAAWFAKCARASVKTQARLDACRAGIMQDSLAKAYYVEEVEPAPSRQPANT